MRRGRHIKGLFNMNRYEIRGDDAVIFLVQRKGPDVEAVIDADDLAKVLSLGRWNVSRRPTVTYAHCRVKQDDGSYKSVSMHGHILGLGPRREADHWDGDGLNNRRSNLRECSHSSNMGNTKISRANTSGYKGVCWFKPIGKWCATIRSEGKGKCLGYFDDIEKAARAYDDAARKVYGEFACVNFPNPGERLAIRAHSH